MPSILSQPHSSDKMRGGVKVVTRYPTRNPSIESTILLMDADNGEILALMDGTWITAMRTGAAAAHSIILLGKRDFSTIGIMGLGNVARSTLLILCDKMQNREFNIKLLRYKGQEKDFYNRFRQFKNLHFTFVDRVEEMVKDSDVVISGATYLSDDICPDQYFNKGVLVVPIHTRGFTNCDLFFDKVFADDLGHVQHFKHFNQFRNFAEISSILNGKTLGRENDSERILVYNIGISIHDINYAVNVYQMMEEKGILCTLPDIEMKFPMDKFWV